MAHNDPNLSDDDNPMPSERSNTSINAENRDDILLPPSAIREFQPNNHRLNLDMRIDHPVILEILRNHPFRFAFSLEQRVPAFYLQQLWYSMAYHPTEGDVHFTVQIGEFVSKLTISRLRRILRLPARDAIPGMPDFEELPSEAQMREDIRALGYDESEEPLTTLGRFKRMYLPQIYFTIFSLINRCLTRNQTGMDKASTAVLRIFLGIVYNRHYDYASLIWTDLVEYASDRANSRERGFLPYQRFLQLVVYHVMNRQPAIPRRSGSPKGPTWTQMYLKLNKRVFQHVLPLPEAFLSIADQAAPSVIEYRERNGLVAPQQPGEPTHEQPGEDTINVRGEGPLEIDERIQDHGDPEHGREERRVVERGTEVGGAPDQPEPTSTPTPTPTATPMTMTTTTTVPAIPTDAPSTRQPRYKSTAIRTRRAKITVNHKRVMRTPSPSSDPEDTESDPEPLVRRRRTTNAAAEAISRIGTQPVMVDSSSEATTPSASTPPPPTSTPPQPQTQAQTEAEDIDNLFDFEHHIIDAPIEDIFSEPPSGD